MTHFQFESTFLLTLLKQAYFSVPPYQRSYSWDEEEYGDFWDDIVSANRADREYFLGTIVLSQEAEPASLSIIDGQQRLATATILLAAIRDHYKNELDDRVQRAAEAIHEDFLAPYDSTKFEERQRLRLNTTDNEFYYKNIISNENFEGKNDSHRLMREAKQFFLQKVAEIREENPNSWRNIISSLHRFMAEKARVVVVRASSNQDAFTIFETLNDRGADLTIADLLKNYLFSTAAHEFDHVQHKWIEAGALLNIHEHNRQFIVFLRHLWSSMHGTTRERDLYRRIKEKITDHGSAVRFSNHIADGARIYEAILSGESDYWSSFSNSIRKDTEALMLLDLEQNRPLLLSLFQHFNSGELATTLRKLVAWSVRGVVVGGIGGGQAEKIYCDAATAVRAGSIKEHHALLSALQRIVPRDSSFHNALVYQRAPKTRITRYMLLEIERFLKGGTEPEYVPNADKEEVNLEHILPKNARPDEWPHFTSDDILLLSNRFGNLTLLKKSENNSIGNRSWHFKKAAFEKSSLEINLLLKEKQAWCDVDIQNRGVWLADIALKVWQL